VSGIRGMLESNGIPTPTSVMTQLLMLKIAQIDPDDSYCVGGFTIKMKLNGLRALEIKYNWRWNSVTVSMSGPPRSITIWLSSDEQKALLSVCNSLQQRSESAKRLRVEEESQNAALDIVEHLIGSTVK